MIVVLMIVQKTTLSNEFLWEGYEHFIHLGCCKKSSLNNLNLEKKKTFNFAWTDELKAHSHQINPKIRFHNPL